MSKIQLSPPKGHKWIVRLHIRPHYARGFHSTVQTTFRADDKERAFKRALEFEREFVRLLSCEYDISNREIVKLD